MKNKHGIMLSFIIIAFTPLLAVAGHLKLHTSSVIIEADAGENAFPVKNESSSPLIMLTTLEPLPEDPEKLVTITPPVSRIEPDDTQIVRFLLKNTANLKTERMARVTFEGIPPKGEKVGNSISINIAQNIPVIVRPKGLKRDYAPWKHLQWKVDNNTLTVHNPSPYVVRFHPGLTLLPSQRTLSLPGSYLLPGKTLSVSLPAKASVTGVKLTPASLYSYMLDPVELPVTAS
ncbi:fimbria/pilus chaperone family protein [Symbiopectobacterium sp. Eva_TO]